MIRRYNLLIVFIPRANADEGNQNGAPALPTAGTRRTNKMCSVGMEATTAGSTNDYSARDRVSDVSIREHEIVATVRAIKVDVYGVTQSYPFNALDAKIDIGEFDPTVLRVPGSVSNLLRSSEIRAP